MPIAYLDVPKGIQIDEKKKLVQGIYDALPFPDDTRIFLREWSIDSVSQNGRLGSEPMRPVLVMHVPQGVSIDAKRKMMQGINSVVAEAYHLPEFVIFMHEHPLDLGSVDGRLFSDDQGCVDVQKVEYGV